MNHASRTQRAGFTLFELLTAIVLLGVAVSIFFQLFQGAMILSEQSAKGRTAARIATERLADVTASPQAFAWPQFGQRVVGELLPLVEKGDDTHVNPAALPSALPTTQRGQGRTTTHYGDFTVETYACLSDADANHVQVVAVVKWTSNISRQAFSLTTTLPRSTTGG